MGSDHDVSHEPWRAQDYPAVKQNDMITDQMVFENNQIKIGNQKNEFHGDKM